MPGMEHWIFNAGETPVAGVMVIPKEGPGNGCPAELD
jgi:hypothetical protein